MTSKYLSKKAVAVITVIATAVTTATLDWAYAKVETYLVNVPIITPVGVTEQQIEVKQRVGRLSGHKYNEDVRANSANKRQN